MGATLYYLVAGRPPFAGGSAADKLLRLSTEDPTPLGQLRPDLPRELVEITGKCLAKRPADRFQTMEDLVRALQPLSSPVIQGRAAATAAVQAAAVQFRAFESLPTAAVGLDFTPANESATSLLRRPAKSSKLPWVIGAVCGVVVAVSIVGAIMSRSEEASAPTAGTPARTVAAPAPVAPARYRQHFESQFFGVVNQAAWSPNEARVALACSDGCVRVFNAGTRRLELTFEEHASAVSEVSWSADGKWIASCERSPGRILVWEAETGRRRFELPTPDTLLYRCPIGLSTDGKHLAFVGAHRVHFVDVEANQIRDPHSPIKIINRFRLGEWPFELRSTPVADAVAIITMDGSVILVSGREQRVTREVLVEPGTTLVRDVVFRADGVALIAEPGRVLGVDPHTGADVPLPHAWSKAATIPTDQVSRLKFDASGSRLLISTNGSPIQEEVLQVTTGEMKARPSLTPLASLRTDGTHLSSTLWSGSGDLFVASGGRTHKLGSALSVYAPNSLVPNYWEVEQVVGGRYLCLRSPGQRLLS